MNMLVNPKAIEILQDVGVDVVGLVDFKDTLFEDDGQKEQDEDDDDDDNEELKEAEEKRLSVSDLMGLVLELRGGNTATVRDIVNLRKYINGRFAAVENKLARSLRPKSMSMSPSNSVPQARTWQMTQQKPEVKCTSDKVKRCSPDSARLGFQDMFHSLQGMMSALESENRQLKERIAQMAREVCKTPLSEDATPSTAIVLPSYVAEPSKEFMAEPDLSLSSSALRTAADGSGFDSAWQDVDSGAADTSVGVDSAAGHSAALSSQRLSGSQRLVPQSATEGRNIFTASLVSKNVVTGIEEEPW